MDIFCGRWYPYIDGPSPPWPMVHLRRNGCQWRGGPGAWGFVTRDANGRLLRSDGTPRGTTEQHKIDACTRNWPPSVRAVKVGHIHKMRVVSAYLLVRPFAHDSDHARAARSQALALVSA